MKLPMQTLHSEGPTLADKITVVSLMKTDPKSCEEDMYPSYHHVSVLMLARKCTLIELSTITAAVVEMFHDGKK